MRTRPVGASRGGNRAWERRPRTPSSAGGSGRARRLMPAMMPAGRDNRRMLAAQQLSQVFPLGSRLNARGRLEVGGCDTIELAREFGTPAYVMAEDDLRARARAVT